MLEERKRIRRNAGQVAAKTSTGPSLSGEFMGIMYRHAHGASPDELRQRIRLAVARLFTEKGMVAEKLIACGTAQKRWDLYIDPMYNLLRSFIAKSLRRPDKSTADLWRTLVLEEIEAQLALLQTTCGFRSKEALGLPELIIKDELGKVP